MRIIGGTHRSRTIEFPKSKQTRPVTDRSKEKIFGILGDLVEGAMVLDLFAGSGSLGIEALSRGAKSVCFVEKNRHVTQLIYRNLKALNMTQDAKILPLSVESAILRLSRRGIKFNIIFLDPPYHKGLVKKILRLLDRFDIVHDAGQIILGRSSQESLPVDLAKLRVVREEKIGQAFLNFIFKAQT